MKVVRLYYRIPPEKGGMEQHIKRLSEEQRKLGFGAFIYFNQGEKTSLNDIQVIKWMRLSKIKPEILRVIIFQLGVIFHMLRKGVFFDVLHIHGSYNSLLFVSALKKISRAKVVCFSIHSSIKDNFINNKLFPILLKRVDVVFTTGYDVCLFLGKRSTAKVIFQPSGIEDLYSKPDTFSPISLSKVENRQIITVANLRKAKNLEMIIRIALHLSTFHFIIIGDGPEKERLQNVIEQKHISNIELKGFLPKGSIKNELDASFLFLLTSFEEGTPTALLEAMARGLPIITSPAGGIEFLVKDGINGFVIKSWEREDYIEKIHLLKTDSNLYASISKNNLELSKEFNWTNIAKRISEIQYDLLTKTERKR